MADSSYQFQVGDLIKYRDPDTGITYTGRIVRPYGRYTAVSQGDARADNAFQMLLHGILTAPRRGRRPKSPYAPGRQAAAG